MAELYKKLFEPEYDVVGIVTDGRELLEAAEKLQPQVIVLGIGMPLLNGLDAGKQIRQNTQGVTLIHLTMNADPELALEAFDCGASGYLLKNCAAVEIIAAVRDALHKYRTMEALGARNNADLVR